MTFAYVCGGVLAFVVVVLVAWRASRNNVTW